jgi:uncharacterized membrane protein YtjA (UPF0391 family)
VRLNGVQEVAGSNPVSPIFMNVQDRYIRTRGYLRNLLCKQQLLTERKNYMISWAITFLVIAIIAAILGFGGIAGTAVGIAKILFVVFLVLFIVSFIMGRRPKL